MTETSSSTTVSTRLERIAELARKLPEDRALTTLAHHLDLDWLREAYRRTRKDGAVGVDGQDAKSYAANLDENLQSLLDRAKSGTYRAPPVRRVHIPKGTGSQTRPIGIPTFEDKVLQRAVAMLLEAVYEQSFLDCSYGFRPGRSAHQATGALRNQLVQMAGSFVLELDVQAFFDSMDHGHLREILRRRVRDGVVLRLIGKWLNAGVLEGGQLTRSKSGSPQGGVISPILANIYLHEVLDSWFVSEVLPSLERPAFLVRYADDAVMGFGSEADARRVLAALPKRFAQYGLKLHPTKTRLVVFRRPDKLPSDDDDPKGGPGSFDFLGFTFFWSKSWQDKWIVKWKTARGRLSASLCRVGRWCRRYRHRPVKDQHAVLARKLRGHYAYFGVKWNYEALKRFHRGVRRLWWKWLGRRTSKRLSWARMNRLLERYPLPAPRIVHPLIIT